jgi:hypothetical protein
MGEGSGIGTLAGGKGGRRKVARLRKERNEGNESTA